MALRRRGGLVAARRIPARIRGLLSDAPLMHLHRHPLELHTIDWQVILIVPE